MVLITQRQQSGFTLLEMITVVTIIAILSAVALPKFSNLQSSAVVVKLDNMAGVLSSVTQLIYSKALAEELTVGRQILVENGGVQITLESGYPAAVWGVSVRRLINEDKTPYSPNGNATESAVICSTYWCGTGSQLSIPGAPTFNSGRGLKVWPRGYSWNSLCGVYYINLRDGSSPLIGTISSGC